MPLSKPKLEDVIPPLMPEIEGENFYDPIERMVDEYEAEANKATFAEIDAERRKAGLKVSRLSEVLWRDAVREMNNG